MTINGLCSKCKGDFLNCRCEQFHPNVGLELSIEEVNALLDYFVKRAGFISYEFDMPVHAIIKRLDEYAKGNKND